MDPSSPTLAAARALLIILLLGSLGAGCAETDPSGLTTIPAPRGEGEPDSPFATVEAEGQPEAQPDGSETPDVLLVGDTTEPDDAAEPEPTPDPEDTGQPEPEDCTEGEVCNDDDPCTFNDVCTEGACAGTAVDCDDEVPCTTDSCANGVCTNAVSDGFCLVDGACWNSGQANPLNPCERCVPASGTKQWSLNDGHPCDDGDPCTIESCQGGACEGEPIVCEEDGDPCTDDTCEGGICTAKPLTGGPCEDADPCTIGEACDKGSCIGELLECDDDLVCTEDLCAEEGCEYVVASGFCLIDGACWIEGQQNPDEFCQHCQPSVQATAWAGNTGQSCDDGDSCTFPDTCQSGLCTGTPTNCADDGNPCTASTCSDGECHFQALSGPACDDSDACTAPDSCTNGLCYGPLDEGLPGCAPEPEGCQFHTDCYPEGVCAKWEGEQVASCSVPCAHDGDCEAGHICSKLPGAANVGYCHAAPAGKQANGTVCGSGALCQSGYCAEGVCAPFCLNEEGCPGNAATCHAAGSLQGPLASVCSANGAGLKGFAQQCTADQVNYGGQFCASGHCDVLPSAVVLWNCSDLCMTKADCLPGQECNITLYADQSHPAAYPYDPAAPLPLHDAVTSCYTPGQGPGSLQDGAQCTLNSQCQSSSCLPLLPGDSTRFCTRFCVDTGDCLSGMACKTELLTLSSTWLGNYTQIGAQPPKTSSWTLVRVCKFP